MKTPTSKVIDIIHHRVRGCGIRKTGALCHVARATVAHWSMVEFSCAIITVTFGKRNLATTIEFVPEARR